MDIYNPATCPDELTRVRLAFMYYEDAYRHIGELERNPMMLVKDEVFDDIEEGMEQFLNSVLFHGISLDGLYWGSQSVEQYISNLAQALEESRG
jgi:hypothetical protein